MKTQKMFLGGVVALCSVGMAVEASAQDVEYRRSSLNMMMLVDGESENAAKIDGWWKEYPFPDKYNAHDVGESYVDVSKVELTQEEKEAFGLYGDTLSGIKLAALAALAEDPESGIVVRMLEPSADGKPRGLKEPGEAKQFPYKLQKALQTQKVANKMIGRWFGFDGNAFDNNLTLISERGMYDASFFNAQKASGDVRGNRALADAGVELIKKSFVTLSSLNFVENEPLARAIRDAVIAEAEGNQATIMLANKVYEKTKDGYTVTARTYLFQLGWDEEVENYFYTEVWSNPSLLMESDRFTLNLVNEQSTISTVLLAKDMSQDDILRTALYRNIDNSFAKLQKQNEVFKPAVPVIGTDPVRAPIGMKEGLEGGEKFEVLEMRFDAETGTTTYKAVGTVKVDKKGVWDNRFNMSDAGSAEAQEAGPQYTTFKGGKKLIPGMLIKQMK